MKRPLLIGTVISFVAAAFPIATAIAEEDGKAYPGLMCRAAQGEDTENVALDEHGGIYNTTASDYVFIVCPIIIDAFTGTRSFEYVRVVIARPSMRFDRFPPFCSLAISNIDTGLASDEALQIDLNYVGAQWNTYPETTVIEFGLGDNNASGNFTDHTFAYLLCQIGPSSTLLYYYVIENNDESS